MRPSDFTKFPFSSVLQNSESEQLAQNIMIILKRTGNTFRELSWEEYKLEREKDGYFSDTEERYFNKVIDYCKNSETAQLFSNSWKIS